MAAGLPGNPSCPSGRPDHPPERAASLRNSIPSQYLPKTTGLLKQASSCQQNSHNNRTFCQTCHKWLLAFKAVWCDARTAGCVTPSRSVMSQCLQLHPELLHSIPQPPSGPAELSHMAHISCHLKVPAFPGPKPGCSELPE
eukprot:1193868-Prorocentrum_minimum.AAC.6